MATYIHGIGASENIDSSGERLSIAGMDISSLDKDGVFTYEHELAKVSGPDGKPVDVSVKIPSQVVGKILKAKKIFSDKDCENDHQTYFWNKCKTPYLYVMGELFDDYTEAAKDLAGKFRYDADRKGQNERPVMNFSVEGGKIAKEGIDVNRSVARKITITVMPCNKVAVAEMVQVAQKPQNDINELFKTETIEIEILDFKKAEAALSSGASTALSGAGPTSPSLMGAEKKMQKAAKPNLQVAPKHPTQRGTKLGTTSSGKDVYSHGMVGEYDNFDHKDHAEAANMHQQAWKNATGDTKHHSQAHHSQKMKLHNARSVSLKNKNPKSTQPPAAKPQQSVLTNQSGATVLSGPNKMHDPQLSGKVNYEQHPSNIKKAMDAGSALAAPASLKQGAALAKANVAKKIVQDKGPILSAPVPKPKDRIYKSQALLRAEEEYAKWEKREQFETFMKSRMPHLTKGEIKAIGQTMALQKSLNMEEALSKVSSKKS